MQMVTGPRRSAVRQLLENSMLQRSMQHPWHCPAASCEYQGELEAPPAENRPAMISCPQCETVSCMACHELWRAGDLEHFGYTCDEFARAKQDGTQAAIRQSTKPCPECRVPIEKDEGCLHMQCRCGHHFCWNCMRPWTGHGNFYRCRDMPVAGVQTQPEVPVVDVRLQPRRHPSFQRRARRSLSRIVQLCICHN
ncbi:RING-type domain-containing protein [Plasmodiophora brassicae]